MYLRKYATATHIYLPIVKRGVTDFAVGADWTPAAGDVKISIDGGAASNVTNLPTAITMGNTAMWDFSLTSGELTGKKIVVTVADSATKAVEDQAFIIETYAHASAELQVDWTDSVRLGLTALPNAAAGANGGLPLSVDASGRVDVLKINGTSQTARDIGASVLLSVGTGTGQVNLSSGKVPSTIAAGDIAADALTASALATDAVQEIRNAITGGAYALSTDANGRVRIVDGTSAGEIDTTAGAVAHVVLCDTTTTNTDALTAAAVWAAGTRTLTGLGFTLGASDLATGVITAAKFAAGAIDAAATSADFAAEINAEVVDALATDTYAEPGQGTPAATASLKDKIGYLYKAWRNKHTSTASTYSLYNDDAATIDQKATQADDGTTFTRGEVATGP